MEKTTFETFRNIGGYEISNLTAKEPSAFNGEIRIKKYKVTIEEIIEPQEVYEQRIQELWDKCDNHHHWKPIESAAKGIGYTLTRKVGNKIEKQ